MPSPIKADIKIKEDSKSVRKLLDILGRALGWFGKPLHKYLDAKADAAAAIANAQPLGKGHGPVHHFHAWW